MPCPKCGGTARRLDLMTAEGRLMVNSCLNCGRVFGDAVLDYHHGLSVPPAPRPDVLTPVWDPEGCLLKTIQRFRGEGRGVTP